MLSRPSSPGYAAEPASGRESMAPGAKLGTTYGMRLLGRFAIKETEQGLAQVAAKEAPAVLQQQAKVLAKEGGKITAGALAEGATEASASTSSVVARYGSAEQRQFLLNAVRETRSLSEAKGVVNASREMRGLGYELENVSLHYRGNQGVDLIFSRGGVNAVVEAKAGGSLSSLRTYSGGLRQGSTGYNISRLQRYLDFGDGTHDVFVNQLLNEAAAGRLESFAAFYRSGRLYELPVNWPAARAIPR